MVRMARSPQPLLCSQYGGARTKSCDPAGALLDYLQKNPFVLPEGWVFGALDDVVYDDHSIIIYYRPNLLGMERPEAEHVTELVDVLTRLLTSLPALGNVDDLQVMPH
jgi:hypothetical protein